MSRVQQLENQISELSHAELKELRAWFDNYDSEIWDRQIENDSQMGELRRRIDQAVVEDRAGQSAEL